MRYDSRKPKSFIDRCRRCLFSYNVDVYSINSIVSFSRRNVHVTERSWRVTRDGRTSQYSRDVWTRFYTSGNCTFTRTNYLRVKIPCTDVRWRAVLADVFNFRNNTSMYIVHTLYTYILRFQFICDEQKKKYKKKNKNKYKFRVVCNYFTISYSRRRLHRQRFSRLYKSRARNPVNCINTRYNRRKNGRGLEKRTAALMKNKKHDV